MYMLFTKIYNIQILSKNIEIITIITPNKNIETRTRNKLGKKQIKDANNEIY